MLIAEAVESRGVFAGIVVERKKDGVIIDERILLVRAKGSERWGLPGGGVEPDDLSLFTALQRELIEELGIYFPLEMLLGNEVCSFRSKNPAIHDIAFVVRIIINEDNDPGIIKIFQEGLPPDSEIEECILIDKNELSSIKLIGPRMKEMINFALNG